MVSEVPLLRGRADIPYLGDGKKLTLPLHYQSAIYGSNALHIHLGASLTELKGAFTSYKYTASML